KSPVNNNSSKYRDIADRFKQGLVGEDLITIENMHPLTLVYRKNGNTEAGSRTRSNHDISSNTDTWLNPILIIVIPMN
ncbi:MAG TPA: hypothetical protein VIR31_01770, partial [Nitrososphaeraceae archaeon]